MNKNRYFINNLAPGDWGDVPWAELSETGWTEPCDVRAGFRAFHDGRALHILMEAEEEPVCARLKGPLDPVHEDSCLEFFFEPEGDGRYFNFEINPLGTLCLAFGRGRAGRLRIVPNNIGQFNILPYRTPEGWGVTYQIPLTFIRLFFPGFAFDGQARGNFYKCGDKTPAPHYLSWAPVHSEAPDYHRAEDFGTLIFT